MLLIESMSADAAFHFAVEEYCMEAFAGEDVFLLWQTGRCAMLGSCQVARAEVSFEAAERLGVQIVRRSSGGGTIYTDLGTFLFTVITDCGPEKDIKEIEKSVAAPIVQALRLMGVPAILQGRNDILVNGRKISGLAQRLKNKRLCTHGSLLFDADMSILEQVLTVDESKIRAKAIASVRSRVGNIRDFLPGQMTCGDFRECLCTKLNEIMLMEPYCFSEEQLRVINTIRIQKYGNPEWTFGKEPAFTYHNQRRFPMGKAEVMLDIKKGIIHSCSIRGDFLGVRPIEELERCFAGMPYQSRQLRHMIEEIDLSFYLGGISAEELLSVLFD